MNLIPFSAGSDFAVGEAWGYKKFYELRKLVRLFSSFFFFLVDCCILYLSILDLLVQTNDGFLVKDTLLLKFGIRHPTYHQKCRDYCL